MRIDSRATVYLTLLLLVPYWSVPASAQEIPKYWIFLDGKPDASMIDVSERAQNRRALRGSNVDSFPDAGISSTYRRILTEIGADVVVESRWLNAVSAHLTVDMVARVKQLPFVRRVRPVARLISNNTILQPSLVESHPLLDYGPSIGQLEDINAIEPLENGINGTGVIIGFLDTPFHDFAHEVFEHLHASNRIIADSNFVGKPDNSSHGFNVASIAVGFKEGQLIGPGYGSSILSATTEYVPTETNEEEDFFIAGMEWLERMGADVVNVSLGYTTFDPGQRDYTQADMDGDTGLTTRAADRAASLGVVVVVAAGNEGRCESPTAGCWYYVSTPADGDSVIAVGAVNLDFSRAIFSGHGPTADGRIKPDVSAPGVFIYFASTSGLYSRGNGTSFAAPLVSGVVAQILQVNPSLNPIQVRDILRETANQAANPDNSLGWGIINAGAAVNTATALATGEQPDESVSAAQVYPNPATDYVFIFINANLSGPATINVHDILGRRVLSTVERIVGLKTLRLQIGALQTGVYFYTVEADGMTYSGRLVIAR